MNIENMTPAQQRAVELNHPQIICVAGPGSGKTTVVSERIKRLINSGVPQKQIAAITYTNAAAKNLEERLKYEAHENGDESMPPIIFQPTLGYCGTLHGFALRMLKEHGTEFGYGERTAIIDEEAAAELIAAKAKQLNCKTAVKKLMELKAKGRPTGMMHTKDELVVLAYIEEMAEGGLLDFDLILTEFRRMLSMNLAEKKAMAAQFTHLFVDEVQDCSMVDWQIFRALPMASKFFVGDPDQAIFGFRGGRPDLLVSFAGEMDMMLLYLEENFRCTTEICYAANELIRHNEHRLDKSTVSAVGTGGRVIQFGQTLNEGDEIAQVMGYIQHINMEPHQIAVLARSNAIAAGFREALKAAGQPVVEPPKSELPVDWPLARAIIEMMTQPHNDTLAYFYCIAKASNNGATPMQARAAADSIRSNAHAKGQRINHGWAGAPPTLMDVPQALARDKISLEARMIIGEFIKELTPQPAADAMLALALEVSRLDRAPATAEPSTGITVTTIHAAKGREWDIVFIVGFEDEVIPGTAKSADIEEERRLAFVGITRARRSVYLSHAASRRATWGNRPVINHRPSRFLKELTS